MMVKGIANLDFDRRYYKLPGALKALLSYVNRTNIMGQNISNSIG